MISKTHLLHTPVIALSLVVWQFILSDRVYGQTVADERPATKPAKVDSVDSKLEFFESKIRPVLVKHCYECHSQEGESIEASLLLDSRDGWSQGGESGPSIVPGMPSSSLLIRALRYDGLQMPPDGKLQTSIIADFEKWILDGAIDPRSSTKLPTKSKVDFAKAAEHWAFQPIVEAKTPELDKCETESLVDAFVLKQLRERSWSPAPPAEETTWLRRVTLDLTGLPPTVEELDEFVSSQESEKRAKTIDRLLASPQYGVRWARHWLDLVRYADTNGADENHDMPNAWRYRDWVVDALNEDKPFDRFVVEQIAGDLLPTPADEHEAGRLLTAPGMLVIGPKMLAEQDKAKMKIDIVDEQIDTLSKTFLGVTLACARCHDHKFDPFSQQDYFALAGILMSTRTMADEAFVSKWMERPLPSTDIELQRAAYQPKLDEAQANVDRVLQDGDEIVLASGKFVELPRKPDKHYPEEIKKRLEEANQELAAAEKARPAFEMVMSVQEASPTKLPIHLRGNHLSPGKKLVDRAVPKVLQDACSCQAISDNESGRLQFAQWLIGPSQPLLARVMVNRVWMWHFGRPIVASPANFGFKGETPSHPDLLDTLARRWIDQGWSLKGLHREILLSATYAMRSEDNRYNELDPENRVLWRMNRKRLEVEPMRDAILFSAGQLDLRLGGTPGSVNDARRTVYAKVNRAALDDMLATFDYVEPANHIEQRPTTTVPYQSLFLMNHPLVFRCGEAIAKSFSSNDSSTQRIEAIFRQTLGRNPSTDEIEKCNAFVANAKVVISIQDSAELAEQQAWASLVRTLIASTEFSWIR